MNAPRVVDLVGSVNAYVPLTDDQAERLIRSFLRETAAELVGVQEWDGPRPDLDGIRGPSDVALDRVAASSNYRWARPAAGGGPLIYTAGRYDLQKVYSVKLVGPGFVGRLPGRKSKLGASKATVGEFVDEVLDQDVAVVNVHLTAEVQVGRRYRRTPSHALRVLRHRRERAALGRLVRRLRRRGFRVYVTGDTNFDGMPLPPLVSCWTGHAREEAKGTLGPRTVDYVYGPEQADDVARLPTRGDHHSALATYRR